MAKLSINDVELDMDLADADLAEKAEAAIKTVMDKATEMQKEVKNYAQSIRATCGLVNECFDSIFGEDTSEKLFGGRRNMVEAMDAFAALCAEVSRQTQAIRRHTQSLAARYSPNRLARRHPDKK